MGMIFWHGETTNRVCRKIGVTSLGSMMIFRLHLVNDYLYVDRDAFNGQDYRFKLDDLCPTSKCISTWLLSGVSWAKAFVFLVPRTMSVPWIHWKSRNLNACVAAEDMYHQDQILSAKINREVKMPKTLITYVVQLHGASQNRALLSIIRICMWVFVAATRPCRLWLKFSPKISIFDFQWSDPSLLILCTMGRPQMVNGRQIQAFPR